ncbi:hypothetical protein [Mycolicibacterium peregrinum]|uniref:hypothetical protein n=1 Tax=Mycolicibacterium peregrinum TaxID=43304 RepID=UPI001F234710|nr:hypothetical protein [Mycolicibacterium peregrinum]
MTTVDGGTNAAYGFNFQFVTTAEYFLRHLRGNFDKVGTMALHIESASLGTSQQHDDIVDFAIEVDGVIDTRIQVKASRKGRELLPSDAKGVFEELNDGIAPNIRLHTNRPLSPKLNEAYRVVNEDGQTVEYAAVEGDKKRPGSETITVDSRSIGELTDALVELVRQFRSENNKSQGRVSCRIVAVVLLHKIFSAAAGEATRRLSALEIIDALSMPDREIAEAAGAFDWGVPVAGIPTFQSTVPRLTLLEQLETIVQQRLQDPDGRIPSVAILAGRTGNGKSALAADFCHIEHNTFSEILWIDSREPSITAARVRAITHDLTGKDFGEGSDASADFVGALASHPGPWLLVFDNAPSMLALRKYMPTMGNGAVVITTTNSTGSWFPQAQMLPVEEFSEDEAIACFASYADLPEGCDRQTVAGIVTRLGLVPLAVSMAGVYFRNAEGTLEELSSDYFDKLEALDDMRAIPAGFDRTAFQAIKLAVEHLGQGLISEEERQRASAILEHAVLLAPELVPLNFIISASPQVADIDLANRPAPEFVDPSVSRSVISTFRTQSIAQRVMNVDDAGKQNAASETIAIHPLVHEILQISYLDRLQGGELQSHALMLMHQLLGWIEGMRTDLEFFAVDQLLLHAEALLELLAKHEPLSTASAQHNRVFGYCKAMLLLELGKCYWARGDATASVQMSKAAVETLQALPTNPLTTMLALDAVTSVVADLSNAGESVEYIVPFAAMSTTLLLSIDIAAATESLRSFVFERAKLVRSFLKKRTEYMAVQAIQQIVAALDGFIALDTSGVVSMHDLVDRVNDLIAANNYAAVMEMIPTLLEGSNDYDRIIVQSIEVTAQLRLGEFDAADAGIGRLLSLRMHEDYMATPLMQGLGKIYQTLIALRAGLPPALSARILQVRDRATQLWELVQGRSAR